MNIQLHCPHCAAEMHGDTLTDMCPACRRAVNRFERPGGARENAMQNEGSWAKGA
jgi:hypothetical protein